MQRGWMKEFFIHFSAFCSVSTFFTKSNMETLGCMSKVKQNLILKSQILYLKAKPYA
jgi:hypothetical protein